MVDDPTPPAGPERPKPLTRSQLTTVVVVVGALAVGSVLAGRLPSVGDVADQPFLHQARLGQPVTLRTATVTIERVEGSTALVDVRGGAASSGLWLVVHATVDATGKPTAPQASDMRLLAADGRTFGGEQAVSQPGCGGLVQPGIPMSCTWAFEIPPDAVAGLTLLVPASAVDSPDDVASVDLGITAEQASVLSSHTEPITLPAATPKGA